MCLLFLYAYKYSLTTCKFWTNFKDISCSLMHISVLTLECIHVLAGMPITVSFGFVSKNKFTSFCFWKTYWLNGHRQIVIHIPLALHYSQEHWGFGNHAKRQTFVAAMKSWSSGEILNRWVQLHMQTYRNIDLPDQPFSPVLNWACHLG